jgi:hypothetical protein
MILLDFIASLPVDNPAQAYAKEWAQRVGELQRRQEELRETALALFDAGDDDAVAETVAEHTKVSAELAQLCHRQMEVMSRLRPSTETMQ